MDIFTELEKLRREHAIESEGCLRDFPFVSERDNPNFVKICDCGADKHNKTLDGIIEWMKIKQRFGCHIRGLPDACSLDDDQDIYECSIACDLKSEGKTKADCQYWEEL